MCEYENFRVFCNSHTFFAVIPMKLARQTYTKVFYKCGKFCELWSMNAGGQYD